MNNETRNKRETRFKFKIRLGVNYKGIILIYYSSRYQNDDESL